MNKNHATVIGRLGKDPEYRQLASGNLFAQFSIATNDDYRPKDATEYVKVTDWHNIKCFGMHAERVQQHLKKGDLVCVDGKMKTDEYVDKNGEKKYSSYILATEINPAEYKKKVDNRMQELPTQKDQEWDINVMPF